MECEALSNECFIRPSITHADGGGVTLFSAILSSCHHCHYHCHHESKIIHICNIFNKNCQQNNGQSMECWQSTDRVQGQAINCWLIVDMNRLCNLKSVLKTTWIALLAQEWMFPIKASEHPITISNTSQHLDRACLNNQFWVKYHLSERRNLNSSNHH